MRNTTLLLDWLRAADAPQRDRLAALAGTSTGYLYQLATCARPRISAALAVAIEDGTATIARDTPVLPMVTVRSLATMCPLTPDTDAARREQVARDIADQTGWTK